MTDEAQDLPLPEPDAPLGSAPDVPELPEGGREATQPNDEPEKEPGIVSIIVNREENGSVSVDVVGNGDLRVTEIETIIKMGLKRWQQQAGV